MKVLYTAARRAPKGDNESDYESEASVEDIEMGISQESKHLITSRPWAPLSKIFKRGQRLQLCTLIYGILLILYWTVE